MLPPKCLTSCAVPYLCMIACPLNRRLEQLTSPIDGTDAILPENDETWLVEFVDKEKPSPPKPSNQAD